ncbi:MAG: hypothetical protein ACR2RL_04145 [Gammaproteobacteria bacterium]
MSIPTGLNDHAAAQLLDFVKQLHSAIEEQYAAELYRYRHRVDERQQPLWDSDDPPF